MLTRLQAKETKFVGRHTVSTSSSQHEKEYGGVLGVFCTYLTVPLLPLVVLLSCNEKDCSVSKVTFVVCCVCCTSISVDMLPWTVK